MNYELLAVMIGPLITGAVAFGAMRQNARHAEDRAADLKEYFKERMASVDKSIANFGERCGKIEIHLGILVDRGARPPTMEIQTK